MTTPLNREALDRVSSTNDSRPHFRGGSWLLEDTAASDVFTPEKLDDEHRLMSQTTTEFVEAEVLPVLDRLEQKDWALNRSLSRLREAGFTRTDLVPLPRVAGREPPVRYTLQHGESRKELDHLRELAGEVRRLGEKGLTITRFKGLGEMDGDELWNTTLDPDRRTLLRVHLEDALKADEMFRTLMGEKVEPRREFIQKHALEVKELDYHGA